eukprot:Seg1297.9 transcript_id=Seg1297.9/GoldUCD/mRNA.D3Y31 product="hypothetical protein" protein_id=Seg1297.9/GoldUCD/D3Y31
MDILATPVGGFEKSVDDVLKMDQDIPEISKIADEVPEDEPGLLTEQTEESLTCSDKIWQLPSNGKSSLLVLARRQENVCLKYHRSVSLKIFRFCFGISVP